MAGRLDVSEDEFREMARIAVERIAAYYQGLAERPVLEPTTSAALRAAIETPLPQEGREFPAILADLETVFRYSRHSAHPRMFGYVASPGTPVNTIGSMLEAALNVNVTAWRSAPPAVEMEHVTIGWLKQMLGYPADAAGLFTSGGSMANLAGLAAARGAAAPDATQQGLYRAGGPLCVYVSEEAHFSIAKAAAILGIGEANVRQVATDGRLRMDPAELARRIGEDRAGGARPFCVVATAGTTATGAIDPIGAIGDVARAEGLWLHVDAAYGGFAALVPDVRRRFAGIERADSVALDPHKWLYLPVGCGCVLYRDPAAARAAFGHSADYTRTIGLERDEAFAFWDYGPELSRPFRALQLWLLFQHVGARRLAEAITANLECAREFERLVRESPDFEMLAPVELSIFCFRHRALASNLDAFNERILLRLQRGGSTYFSNATVGGRFGLRGCVLNYRTTPQHMRRALADAREAAEGVISEIGGAKSVL